MRRAGRLLPALLTTCLVGPAVAAVPLTPAERAFLDHHPTLTLGAGVSFEPFVFRNADGSVDGFDAAVARRVERHTGLRIRFEFDTWGRMVERAKAREVDGLTAAILSPDRAGRFLGSEPYFMGTRLVLVRAGNPDEIHGLDDLTGKRAALQRGNALFTEPAQGLITDLKVVYFATLDEVIMAVARGDADFTVLDETAPYLAERLGLNNAVQFAFAVGQPHRLRFLVRDDWPEAVSLINKGLAAIPEAELRALRRQWFGELHRPVDRRVFWRALWVGLAGVLALLYWSWTLRTGRRQAERLLAEVRARDLALERANAELQAAAQTDHLTGLANRAHLDQALDAVAQTGEAFAVIMVDLDHFKRINDHLGHLAGDAVLKACARLLRGQVRDRDLIGRWGGEEFLVLIPQAGLARAEALAERLRAACAANPWPEVDQLTVSLGVTEGLPGEAPHAVVARADAALYRAKAAGRDRVWIVPTSAGEADPPA